MASVGFSIFGSTSNSVIVSDSFIHFYIHSLNTFTRDMGWSMSAALDNL